MTPAKAAEGRRTPGRCRAIPTGGLLSVAHPLRAKGRSADFQSAVSQNCILRTDRLSQTPSDSRRPADCKSAIRQIENLRYGGCVGATPRPSRLCGWLALILCCFAFAGEAAAQSAATNVTVRFRTVDIFVDSGATPLAAYQLEFAVTNASAKIVGIEGGEHPAFAQPPFYDPKAMQHERVVIAAFSTEAAAKLPKGKTRVATIHLQTSGSAEPKFNIMVQTAAGEEGSPVQAEARTAIRNAK